MSGSLTKRLFRRIIKLRLFLQKILLLVYCPVSFCVSDHALKLSQNRPGYIGNMKQKHAANSFAKTMVLLITRSRHAHQLRYSVNRESMTLDLCIIKPNDPDIWHVISRDSHLDKSHDKDLGQLL